MDRPHTVFAAFKNVIICMYIYIAAFFLPDVDLVRRAVSNVLANDLRKISKLAAIIIFVAFGVFSAVVILGESKAFFLESMAEEEGQSGEGDVKNFLLPGCSTIIALFATLRSCAGFNAKSTKNDAIQ